MITDFTFQIAGRRKCIIVFVETLLLFQEDKIVMFKINFKLKWVNKLKRLGDQKPLLLND